MRVLGTPVFVRTALCGGFAEGAGRGGVGLKFPFFAAWICSYYPNPNSRHVRRLSTCLVSVHMSTWWTDCFRLPQPAFASMLHHKTLSVNGQHAARCNTMTIGAAWGVVV